MPTVDNALASLLETRISLELPLKYPEVYHVTYTPDFPELLVNLVFCILQVVSVLIVYLQMIEI